MNDPVVLFDGTCNLCNASVRFVIKRDKKELFNFASLQSDFAKQLFKKHGFNVKSLDSIILYEDGKFYWQSDAALKIARHLSGLWPLLYGFIILPGFIRDNVYNFIAENRYKWFGKKDHCELPAPGMKERFLDRDEAIFSSK